MLLALETTVRRVVAGMVPVAPVAVLALLTAVVLDRVLKTAIALVETAEEEEPEIEEAALPVDALPLVALLAAELGPTVTVVLADREPMVAMPEETVVIADETRVAVPTGVDGPVLAPPLLVAELGPTTTVVLAEREPMVATPEETVVSAEETMVAVPMGAEVPALALLLPMAKEYDGMEMVEAERVVEYVTPVRNGTEVEAEEAVEYVTPVINGADVEADAVPEDTLPEDTLAPAELDKVTVGYDAVAEESPEAALLAVRIVAVPDISEVRLAIVVSAVETVVSAVESVNGSDEIAMEVADTLVEMATAEVEAPVEAVATDSLDAAVSTDEDPEAATDPLELALAIVVAEVTVSIARDVTVVGTVPELVEEKIASALVETVSEEPGMAKEYDGTFGTEADVVGATGAPVDPEVLISG